MKWLATPIYKPFGPFTTRPTLLRGHTITMVINHLLKWDDLPSTANKNSPRSLEPTSGRRQKLKAPPCLTSVADDGMTYVGFSNKRQKPSNNPQKIVQKITARLEIWDSTGSQI